MVDKLPILLAVSVEQEKEALLKGLGKDSRFDVLVCGVGMAKAAVRTANQLNQKAYCGVINLGIAGGFPTHSEIGSVVMSDRVLAPEIGAESPQGFLSIDELGFGSQEVPVVTNPFFVGKIAEKRSIKVGTILTVLTATGTEDTLQSRALHGALAEAMEGFGVATATEEQGLPFAEIRTISNLVGIRDKSKWDFSAAFKGLTDVAKVLKEVNRNEDCFFSVSE